MAQQNNAFGLASLFDPSVAVDQAALDRNMAIAQALRQQSLTPVDVNGRQIGGMGYKISPWEGVAKLVQAWAANRDDAKNDKSRQTLAEKTMQAYANALRGGDPVTGGAPASGGPSLTPQDAQATMAAPQPSANPLDPGAQPGPTTANLQSAVPTGPAQSQAPAQGGMFPSSGQFSLPALLRGAVIEQLGGTPMASAYAKNFETPEAIRTLQYKGQDPRTVGGLETAKLQRDVTAPMTLGRAAFAAPGPDGKWNISGLPGQIAGANVISDPSNPSGFKYVQMPGSAEAIEAEAAATERGKGLGLPGQQLYDSKGNPLPFTSRTAQLGGAGLASAVRGAQVPPAIEAANRAGPFEATQTPDGKVQFQSGGPAPASGSFSSQPLGTEGAQKDLDTSWGQLKSNNREAQTTSSYLDNIVTAAHKGALVGPGAERREMVAGLLQIAGINEKVNENAVTQTQLLDKYHNQIVSRLGQGGLGTDAARAILDSAYPGKPMNLGAIDEAAANLKGAQGMVQAKTRFLLEPASKRDTAEYQKREILFDQAADPRVFQALAIKDPAQRKAFAEQAQQQDPTFNDRLKTLRELGAIK